MLVIKTHDVHIALTHSVIGKLSKNIMFMLPRNDMQFILSHDPGYLSWLMDGMRFNISRHKQNGSNFSYSPFWIKNILIQF